MSLPNRKRNRLDSYNYNSDGSYFITVCVKDRKAILSEINVGTGVPDCPQIHLLQHGKIADKYIHQLNDFYNDISVDKYVVMPDHIHFIITIKGCDGQSRTPVPTRVDNKNSKVAKFISTFKRFCNREFGENIWQSRYYDHIIRNQDDYDEKWKYIENNPEKQLITHDEL